MIEESTIGMLLEKAQIAQRYAYAPYSRYSIGACLLTENGQTVTGCNIENASYGNTICAERTAIFKAVSEGMQSFFAIAIVANGEGIPYPCGACLQVLSEFGLDIWVISSNQNLDYRILTVKELLPHSFSSGVLPNQD